MRPKVIPLRPALPVLRKGLPKDTRYICSACGLEFVSYPGLPIEWPESGNGLPAHCDNQDCHDYLSDLSLMREWMMKDRDGRAVHKDENGTAYELTGHAALARRIAERRQMVAHDAEGWR